MERARATVEERAIAAEARARAQTQARARAREQAQARARAEVNEVSREPKDIRDRISGKAEEFRINRERNLRAKAVSNRHRVSKSDKKKTIKQHIYNKKMAAEMEAKEKARVLEEVIDFNRMNESKISREKANAESDQTHHSKLREADKASFLRMQRQEAELNKRLKEAEQRKLQSKTFARERPQEGQAQELGKEFWKTERASNKSYIRQLDELNLLAEAQNRAETQARARARLRAKQSNIGMNPEAASFSFNPSTPPPRTLQLREVVKEKKKKKSAPAVNVSEVDRILSTNPIGFPRLELESPGARKVNIEEPQLYSSSKQSKKVKKSQSKKDKSKAVLTAELPPRRSVTFNKRANCTT